MTEISQNKLADELVLCIGAPKAGTTSLFDLLSRHPEVSTTKLKESHFFSEPRLYSSGYDRWLSHGFYQKKEHRLYFDADPLYMFQPDSLNRIKDCAPFVRIIVMLRSPVERAFSEYLAMRNYQDSNLAFKNICSNWLNAQNDHDGNLVIIKRSLYFSWVEHVLLNFPANNVYFMFFDDFASNMRGEFLALQKWLNLTVIDVGVSHENRTGDPRNRLIAKLISHPQYWPLRKFLGYFMPIYSARRRIAEWVWQLNSKPYDPNAKPKLDYRDVPVPLLEVFHDDLLALQAIVPQDLSRWIRPIADAIDTIVRRQINNE